MNRTPRPTAFLPVSLFMALAGYGGLTLLLLYTQPTLWPRWLLFFLIVLAACGTLLPVSAFLNYRFSAGTPVSVGTITRPALLGGVYLALLAWLQVGRVFNPGLALLWLVGLLILEMLIRLWERGRWRPE